MPSQASRIANADSRPSALSLASGPPRQNGQVTHPDVRRPVRSHDAWKSPDGARHAENALRRIERATTTTSPAG